MPLPEEVVYSRKLAKVMAAVRMIFYGGRGRAKGARAMAVRGSRRRAEIQAFALSHGWPKRGATKLTIIHFTEEAPMLTRCDRRTVTRALKDLR